MKTVVNYGNNVLSRLAKTNYYTARTYGVFRVYLDSLRYNNKPPLLIYQMGKVGSSSVVKSLKGLNLDIPIYHVHALEAKSFVERERICKQNFSKSRVIPQTMTRSLYLQKRIKRGISGEKWKVITLVRDPISKNVSAFFQNLKQHFSDYDKKVHNLKGDDLNNNPQGEQFIEEMINLFWEKGWHFDPLTWFDKELKPVFDVDVYASPFPKSQGFKIYQGQSVDVLLIRLEDLDRCVPEAFRQFLDIEDFSLIKENNSNQKYYSKVYKKFISALILEEAYVDRFYGSRHIRHFYTDQEIDGFRAKWRIGQKVS